MKTYTYLPVANVPVDLSFISESLERDYQESKYLFDNKIPRSVGIDSHHCARFTWPNIYDIIDFVASERLQAIHQVNLDRSIVDDAINDLAAIHESISCNELREEDFMCDPSGVPTVLRNYGYGIFLDIAKAAKISGTEDFAATLLEDLRKVAHNFNAYIIDYYGLHSLAPPDNRVIPQYGDSKECQHFHLC